MVGGWTIVIMRIADIFLSLPTFYLILTVNSMLTPSIFQYYGGDRAFQLDECVAHGARGVFTDQADGFYHLGSCYRGFQYPDYP